MKSKAAIGNHPIHPALVTIPIGSFVLALIGDIATSVTHDQFWYTFAYYCVGIGILSGLLAAVFGLIDYFSVRMSARGKNLATIHLVLNVIAIVLYIVDWYERRDNRAFLSSGWAAVMALEIAALVILSISGWIGGEMAYIHKVGVVENADLEATAIGSNEVSSSVEKREAA